MIRVQETLDRARQWTAGLAPSLRVMVAILIAAILVAIAIFTPTRQEAGFETLFSGRRLSPHELALIESAFGKAGLNTYEIRDGVVHVPHTQRGAFVTAVTQGNALPASFDQELRQELMRANPFESREQFRARVQVARQRELARVLCAMDDIEDASVHFDEVESTGMRREKHVRAMVVIKPVAAAEISANRIRSIRELVAASRALLTPENVTVTDLGNGVSYTGPVDAPRNRARAGDYAQQKTAYEQQWTDKVQKVLSFIPGVEIATNVQLCADDLAGMGRSEAPVSYVPASVTVSVGIPHSYYHRVRRAQGPRIPEALPQSASIERVELETREKVAQLVQALLPPSTSVHSSEVVVATFTDLENSPGLMRIALPTWLAWSQNPTLVACLAGFVFVGGLLVWGIWHDLRAVAAPTVDISTETPPEGTIASRSEAHDQRDSEVIQVEPSEFIHRELTRLVREDPETAAEMLGDWIRKAG